MFKFIIIISDLQCRVSVYSLLFHDWAAGQFIKDDYALAKMHLKRLCICNRPSETSFSIIVNCVGKQFYRMQ